MKRRFIVKVCVGKDVFTYERMLYLTPDNVSNEVKNLIARGVAFDEGFGDDGTVAVTWELGA